MSLLKLSAKPLTLWSLAFFLLTHLSLFAQSTNSDVAPETIFQQGWELLQKNNYASARQSFERYMSLDTDPIRQRDAAYYAAYCALQLYNEDAEFLIRKFIQDYPEHPKAELAYYDLGTFYYEERVYQKAIIYLEKALSAKLSKEKKQEVEFKLGYSYFSRKDNDKALNAFNSIKRSDSPYNAAAAYYAGYIFYQNGELDRALQDMLQAEKNASYAASVPPIVAAIYYRQGRYDELIRYADAKGAAVKNSPDFSLYLAEAYYNKAQFGAAASQYESYHGNGRRSLSPDVQYRMAYSHFMSGAQDKATNAFKNLALREDSVGVFSSYYMGMIYYESENKLSAINAFDKARKNTLLPQIAENSQWYYALLQYDAENFNQAITAFEEYLSKYPKSKNAAEATDLLSEAYLNTSDYDRAIAHIERSGNRSARMKKAYQKVTFLKGTELFNAGKYPQAIEMFNKSKQFPEDQEFLLMAHFWTGETYSVGKLWEDAINAYAAVFRVPGNERSDYHLKTRYGIGYAYFNSKQYDRAVVHFKTYVDALEKANNKQFYDDALLRLADCYYANKAYSNALTSYDIILAKSHPERDYAYFQKGLMQYLLNQAEPAKNTFNQFLKEYPNSRFADAALFEKANIDFENGNYQGAVSGFAQVISQKPESKYIPYAHLRKGISHANLNENSRTIQEYIKIIEQFPRHPVANSAIYGLQEALVLENRAGEYDKYFAMFKKANPDNKALESIEFESIKTLYFNQNYSKAISSINEFLRSYPATQSKTEATFYLAESHYRLGNFDQSLQSHKELAQKTSHEYLTRSIDRVAELEFKKGNYQAAINAFARLLPLARNRKDEYIAYVGLMESHFQLATYDSSIFYAKRILAQGNVTSEAQSRAGLYLGKSYKAMGDFDAAIQELKSVAGGARDVYAAEAQVLWAEILYTRKNYKGSIDILIDFATKFASHEYWLGKAFILIAENYVGMDEIFQAKATLNSVIERSPVKEIVGEAKTKLSGIERLEKNMEVKSDTIN